MANLLCLTLRTSIRQSKESLLKQSLDFAEKYIKISSDDIIGVFILGRGYFSIHTFSPLFCVDTFHWSKGNFPVICAMTSFKIRNHYLVANLTVQVHSAEDCGASGMKLSSSMKLPKQVLLFVALL